MHEKDECHFHNKKKKEYCEEIEFSEEEESYDSPMNAILNRIETLESVMVQFSEENESHYEIIQSIEHIVKIQRVLIVVHVVLYAYIIHLITDDGENNFIRSLFNYQWIITTISILKHFILLTATSFYSYLLKNINSSLSSASLLSSSLSTEEIENMLMDYDESFSYNDNSYYYNNYSVY
jgi:hypothetical protein